MTRWREKKMNMEKGEEREVRKDGKRVNERTGENPREMKRRKTMMEVNEGV